MATIDFPTHVAPATDRERQELEALARAPLATIIRGRNRENAAIVETTAEGLISEALQDIGTHDHRDSFSVGFRGCETNEDAALLALRGWDEPVEDILRTAHGIRLRSMVSLVPRYEASDEPADGGVNVDAFLAGEDECFWRSTVTEHEQHGRGHVRIVMEPCVSAGTSTRDIVERGGILCAVVWALERSGARVSIEYRSLVESDPRGKRVMGSRNAHVYARLKSYGERLSPRRLAFWLCHPAASRIMVFAAVHRMGGVAGDVGWSSYYAHGGRVNLPTPKHAVYAPMLHIRDMPSVEQWVATVAKAAGIEFARKG